MKRKDRRHREGQGIEKQAQRRPACRGPLGAHLASQFCATQWMRGGWPPWDGWPPEALYKAAGAMFVGPTIFSPLRITHDRFWLPERQSSCTLESISLPVTDSFFSWPCLLARPPLITPSDRRVFIRSRHVTSAGGQVGADSPEHDQGHRFIHL